jgi:signal transduction histidine kinase
MVALFVLKLLNGHSIVPWGKVLLLLETACFLLPVAWFWWDQLLLLNLAALIVVLTGLSVSAVCLERVKNQQPGALVLLIGLLIFSLTILVLVFMRVFQRDDLIEPVLPAMLGLLALGFCMSLALRSREQNLYQQTLTSRDALLIEQRQSIAIKDQFLITMSHELRSPMNGVSGALSLIDQAALSEVDQVYLHTAISSASQLTRILDSVLRFTEMQSGSVLIRKEPFDPLVFLASLISDIEDRCHDKKIRFEQHFPATSTSLLGDPEQIRLIVAQLCDNAIKFTPSGGAVKLNMSLEPRRGREVDWCIEVSDTGPGIDSQAQSRLTSQSVWRTQGAASHGGMGIGLSLCHYLATKMGGELNVHPVATGGTLASLKLHLSAADPQMKASAEWVNSSAEIGASRSLRILVAEDNPVNQQVIEGILGRLGHSSTIVGNGEEALNLLRQNNKFDLVLMDCQMPTLDGYETTRQLRKFLPDLPVVALTANALSIDKDRCLQAGMNDYLAKPVRIEQIRQILRRFYL